LTDSNGDIGVAAARAFSFGAAGGARKRRDWPKALSTEHG
jgi:hypothetical protein